MKNNTLSNLGLAILRIVTSGLMLTHGIGKFNQLISGEEIKFPSIFGIGSTPSLFLAVIGELVCPILIIIGLKTRWAAIPSAITMGVAAFIIHAGDPIGKRELAIFYFFAFVVIALVGPGKYSIDRR